MSNAVQNVNTIKPGTCPHGCAPGACPICSNMGGGGLRPGERAQKPGEMSYHECAMLGALMRARALRIKNHEKNLLNHAEAIKNFEQKMEAFAQKMADFASRISQNILLKPAAFVIKNIAIPVLNGIKNLPAAISKFINTLSQIKTDIQDKLNAIFGEAKAFIQKKASELVSTVKSKLKGLFKIFKRNKTKDDETKIDEDKKIFRLKKFISKIWKKKDNDTKN